MKASLIQLVRFTIPTYYKSWSRKIGGKPLKPWLKYMHPGFTEQTLGLHITQTFHPSLLYYSLRWIHIWAVVSQPKNCPKWLQKCTSLLEIQSNCCISSKLAHFRIHFGLFFCVIAVFLEKLHTFVIIWGSFFVGIPQLNCEFNFRRNK